ncbi:MAG: energy transducer TonB [Gammaproteobacteria bacterium]|jgi:TonB family protein|nr:energy transducer TonB [Gammaproteobacteria bacterium]
MENLAVSLMPRGRRAAALWSGVLLAGSSLLMAPAPRAELLCDCTRVVGSCSASVGLEGNTVAISSDTRACSRVDYLIEGQPFTALVVNGQSELPWPGLPQRDPSIVVENCRICAEAGATMSASAGASAESAESAADTESGAQPIIKVLPEYPRGAWMNRVEGDVIIEYGVTPAGAVTDIRVVSSSNPVFELASINAVSRYRFAAADGDADPRTGLREEFRFRLVEGGTRTSVSSVSP